MSAKQNERKALLLFINYSWMDGSLSTKKSEMQKFEEIWSDSKKHLENVDTFMSLFVNNNKPKQIDMNISSKPVWFSALKCCIETVLDREFGSVLQPLWIIYIFYKHSWHCHKIKLICQRSQAWRCLHSLNASCFFCVAYISVSMTGVM